VLAAKATAGGLDPGLRKLWQGDAERAAQQIGGESRIATK